MSFQTNNFSWKGAAGILFCGDVNTMAAYEDFALYYDALTENVDYSELCDYVYGILKENGAGEGILLDLACGTGTLSFLLSERGFDVVGVDVSEDMLSEAQNKALERGVTDLLFLRQSMQELDLFGTIDACVCTLDGINHLTELEDVKTAFERVSLFMNPGGVFVFDVNTLHKHRKILANNTFVYDLDEVYCVWQNSLEEATDTIEISLDLFEEEDGAYYRTEEHFFERAYSQEKLTELLNEVGFQVLKVYDWMTKNPAHKTSEKEVFVCRKI